MYERFFGFTERPFELTANPRYLFLTERYREALGTLTYGLSSRKGMLVMTGEAGTGKTTMLTVAMAGVQPNQLVAYLSNPTLSRSEFIEFMTEQLGLPEEVAGSKTKFLRAITKLLEDRAAAGNVTALVIDEAHSLPNELLEEVRLLANIEKPDQKLLTVILVGQPELAGRLNDPSLRQLKQRVALRCELVPLTLRESAAYIAKRISLAGGDSAQVFTREAVLAVYEYSGGIPRTINVICDNALVSAFARDESIVSQQVVSEVARDFDLQPHVDLGDQSLMGVRAAGGAPRPPAGSSRSVGPSRSGSGLGSHAAASNASTSPSSATVVAAPHPSAPHRPAAPGRPPVPSWTFVPPRHCRRCATISRRSSGDPSGRRSSSGSDEPTKDTRGEDSAMSRIDEALRRARGEQPEPTSSDVDEVEAPWEFAEGAPVPARTVRSVAPRAEPPTARISEQAGAEDDVALPPASSATGTLPEGGLFVSLGGDEKMVGAGLRQAVVEEYRKLASSLHQAQLDHRLQVVLVASAVPGEGKSLTAANVALTLTTSYSRRVLLIDADLRRPSLHGLFHAPVTSGLSEGLDAATAARVSAIQLSPLLALLPAGRPVENPVPLLTSERMGELVRDARQHFDWIVIDTPPVALLTDANLLTKECDGALLVVHANRTPYALVQKAVQALGKPKIFGVILNRLEEQVTVNAGYGKYSGYYTEYGKGGK